MATIKTSLQIKAPVQIVFDLCRSIDLHMISTEGTHEKAIAGVTTGLINKNETVTWQARHLFKKRYFQTLISAMEPYHYFRDEMIKGDFKSFYHEHFFEPNENGTLMTDKIKMEAPLGLLGKLVNHLFLKNYIQKFLSRRNQVIKQYAESGEWKKILNCND
ncbi:MAG: cell division protein [Sphingobacteriales bacterium]|nr:MAG: cell division protein [Sphingobacteriales bacterium]